MRAKLLILFYLAAFCPALFAQPADTLKLYETGPVEVIHPRREQPIISLYPVRDAYVLSQGKKTEVLEINPVFINTVENNPRQVFNKIPGVMVWEMDGTGNQVSIATRGLNPHRSWELNVRQNGFILNSDVFGYPEAHYNPPIQAVQRIEMIRGAGALQYGQQFGGMLNYVLKEGGPGPVSVESETSVGSFGLFGSYTAIGGTKGKWKYYGYYNHRNSDGWRKNSDYTFDAWHVGATCSVNKKINIHAEVSRMAYINHFAAGLSD
ncbi:MAG TPA: TonB-dependent receptor plug domain-containing protein, partial [Bacteroidia bacterium]|nr:TonB-dependent receptor plug domain-containing protein [Bacteroidia bacterium]